MFRSVMIGNGKMAEDCLKILIDASQVSLVIASSKEQPSIERLAKICRQNNIKFIDAPDVNAEIDLIAQQDPNYIFNVNSYQIIKSSLLNIPSNGIINFHNGPLPKYGGVNVCSWAILNGVREYGVTWHYVDDGIDTGDIICSSMFRLKGNETVLALIMRCISEGIDMFRNVVAEIVSGEVTRQVQKQSQATYYSKRDMPFDGEFPVFEDRFVLDRLRRAIAFHPISNDFFRPHIDIKGRSVWVDSFELKSLQKGGPGEILSVSPDAVLVAAKDCSVALTGLVDAGGELISLETCIEKH